MNFLALISIIIVVILLFGLYFLPSFVAYHRGHKNKLPVLIVNFFLGWTGIFWVLTLAWSFLYDSVLPATQGAVEKRGGLGKYFIIIVVLLALLFVANAYLMQSGSLTGLFEASSPEAVSNNVSPDQSGVAIPADEFLRGQ